jgi:uncharacterized protein YajQ (UPF0234 family)
VASDNSFDIEAGFDRQEVDNAINQASREVATRFDFKNTDTTIAWSGDEGVLLESSTEDRLKAAYEVFRDKIVRRKVSLKVLDPGEERAVGQGRWKLDVELVSELPSDIAKLIVKDIKATKLKVTPTNMGDKVRVSAKARDDLQEVQAMVKSKDYEAPMRFTNYQ